MLIMCARADHMSTSDPKAFCAQQAAKYYFNYSNVSSPVALLQLW
jgi:hypothetical protein